MTDPDASVRRGEIHWVDWNPSRGSEQTGRRPGLIVQNDPFNSNPNYPLTIMVAVSTIGRNVPTHVRVEPNSRNGLKAISYIKCEQIVTVSLDRLDGYIGTLEETEMVRIDRALKRVLSLS